jgi:hypothetical protein
MPESTSTPNEHRPLNHERLTTLEQAVMKALLDGDDDILSLLQEQLKATLVVKREMTGGLLV